jgi:putative peptide zinc metalloprotease protein
LFNRLEPRIRFFWTRSFLVFSAGCILFATLLLWTGREQVAGSFAHALRWETLLIAWLTVVGIGVLHEFAHGLTCKHYGGEVREIGFLLMYFMPCFYCNVSDAWLFREKSKRLWVTFAGGYFELFLWSLAVFVWRLTMPDTMINYLAFIVLTLSGIDSFFNFNPLIKLDGYYLLSDMVEIPNLRQRSIDYLKGKLRRVLWGAPKADREPRGRFLLGFGIASWVYSIGFLGLMLFAISRYFGAKLGPLVFAAMALFGLFTMRTMFQGLSNGEVFTMIRSRYFRTTCWILVLGAVSAMLCFVKIEDRVGGSLEVRSALRAELRAPVAGFLQEIHYDRGDSVSPGAPVVRLDIPDLSSRLAQKQAEISEAQAALQLLEAGTRPAERDAQRNRVKTAKQWRDQARRDLDRSKQLLERDLDRLEHQIAQHKAEQDAAEDSLTRAKQLLDQNVVTAEEYRDAQR